jgi:D-beta-D-heptose 7-phosphate kinase/D-beta-D-heptose 1-phosphate adenosyltransferase
MTGAEIVAATLDRDGAIVFTAQSPPYRTYSQPSPQSHASGAGDTFLSALTLGLASGASPQLAGELAATAAAVVVSKPHTAVCSQAELLDRLYGTAPSGKLAALVPVLEAYRRKGLRIVLTNGCFDILHPGHITYLQQAKAQGDVLIVGVNSDDSIRRLKGPDRPINSLEDRLKVLAALSCIDHLVAFAEETPHRLIEAVEPDVFVKGGDYTRETLPEAGLVEQLGGSVKILPFVDGRSTTGIISRICAVSQHDPEKSLTASGEPT